MLSAWYWLWPAAVVYTHAGEAMSQGSGPPSGGAVLVQYLLLHGKSHLSPRASNLILYRSTTLLIRKKAFVTGIGAGITASAPRHPPTRRVASFRSVRV
jgi:hypothetical protein